jgi:hypothetical protein
MSLIQPLDLEAILVNTLAGSGVIFLFLGIFVVAALAAKFRMTTEIFAAMIFLFIVMIAGTNIYSDVGGIYLLVISILCLIFYYMITRMFKT